MNDDDLIRRTRDLAAKVPPSPHPLESESRVETLPRHDHEPAWEPPVPLGYIGKPPVFPAHRLPPWLNQYVCAVAEAMQVPVDLPAMLAVAVLATAAGGRAVVEIKPDWREPLNLYIAVAMPPGARKTPVFMRIIAPLVAYEQAAVERAKAEVIDAKVRKAVAAADATKAQAEAERAGADAKEEAIHFAAAMATLAEDVDIPTLPRLIADDATPEALTSLLHEQGGRIGLFSDEGEVFGMMAGRYSSSGPNLAVYLKGHVGSPIRVDRRGRTAEYVQKPALTLGLTVQPQVLESVVAIEGARGRGLLGRFLWSMPPSNIGRRDADPEAIPRHLEDRFVANMTTLIASLAEWVDPVPLPFTFQAREAIVSYQRSLEPRLAATGDLGHIADWAAKLVGHVGRLAGLLYLAANVETWRDHPIAVDVDVVADAIHFADYLIAHALMSFDAMQSSAVRLKAELVLRWIDDHAIERFTRREAHHALQHAFADVGELKDALSLLEGNGFIRVVPEPDLTARRGRPPSPKYVVNPLIA